MRDLTHSSSSSSSCSSIYAHVLSVWSCITLILHQIDPLYRTCLWTSHNNNHSNDGTWIWWVFYFLLNYLSLFGLLSLHMILYPVSKGAVLFLFLLLFLVTVFVMTYEVLRVSTVVDMVQSIPLHVESCRMQWMYLAESYVWCLLLAFGFLKVGFWNQLLPLIHVHGRNVLVTNANDSDGDGETTNRKIRFNITDDGEEDEEDDDLEKNLNPNHNRGIDDEMDLSSSSDSNAEDIANHVAANKRDSYNAEQNDDTHHPPPPPPPSVEHSVSDAILKTFNPPPSPPRSTHYESKRGGKSKKSSLKSSSSSSSKESATKTNHRSH